MSDKVVRLGSRLHYPITITKLLKKPGDSIRKQENILEYKFSWRRRIGDDQWSNETTYTEYDSPAEGLLKQWRIEEGAVLEADTACMLVEEACSHEVQIQGMCSLCGADMTEINWADEGRDTDRANINMTHDQTGLMVSANVARKAEFDTQKRLLNQRKLSLVVDLDQTIIHACIDPTVGEWQSDPTNPNHDAVKGVKGFQLDDGPRGSSSGFTYYIKLRPGLEDFLEEISTMYELHVYTMGTRAYAHNIRRIVDPDRKLFGDRVISRDENGSITAKSLQRLFPVSTNMVVIIDDRADVWPFNRPNLIKVAPYDFFKGIGDINGSFLPKRQDILPAPPTPNGNTATTAPATIQSIPATEGTATTESPKEIVRVVGSDEEESLKIQAEEQEKTLEKQLVDRPLQHMQEELDKEDEQGTQDSDTGNDSSGLQHHRQNLLTDDDEELIALQDHLTDLHKAFYDTYDKRRQESGEIGDEARDMLLVPDVGDILDELKSNVLEGMVIVLSGLVPLGAKVEESEIGVQAQSFGAQVLDKVSKRVTHLVVATSRPRTKKVQQAAKIPSIKIVNQNWLTDCLSQWRRLDERPYFIDVMDADRERSDDTQSASEADDDDLGAQDLRNFDWDTADKELDDFLGLDDDDDDEDDDGEEDGTSSAGDSESGTESDTESNGTEKSETAQGTKRKSRADESDGEPEGDALGESVLAKKQRLARSRGASSLRSVRTPNGELDMDDEANSLPTPGLTTGDEEPFKPLTQDDKGKDEDTNYDDDLERDLLAELEAAEM